MGVTHLLVLRGTTCTPYMDMAVEIEMDMGEDDGRWVEVTWLM